MKKLLLFLSVISLLSCKTDPGTQTQGFSALGEVTSISGQTLNFESDFNERIRFTNNTVTTVSYGDRILVYGQITAQNELGYEAELLNLSPVEVKSLTPEGTSPEELGKDGCDIYSIMASGDYATFFINGNYHELSLLILKEEVDEKNVMTITAELYNKTSETKMNNLVSFDLSKYSSYKTVAIHLTYVDKNGSEAEKNLIRIKK